MRTTVPKSVKAQTDTQTHTQRLTQRLGGIIPALPAHCGDLSLDRTCCLHGEQVSDQVSAAR